MKTLFKLFTNHIIFAQSGISLTLNKQMPDFIYSETSRLFWPWLHIKREEIILITAFDEPKILKGIPYDLIATKSC